MVRIFWLSSTRRPWRVVKISFSSFDLFFFSYSFDLVNLISSLRVSDTVHQHIFRNLGQRFVQSFYQVAVILFLTALLKQEVHALLRQLSAYIQLVLTHAVL